MTPARQQELANRAHSLAVQIECIPACESIILKVFESIERETWLKAAQHIKDAHRADFGHERLYGAEAELYAYYKQQAEAVR